MKTVLIIVATILLLVVSCLKPSNKKDTPPSVDKPATPVIPNLPKPASPPPTSKGDSK